MNFMHTMESYLRRFGVINGDIGVSLATLKDLHEW